jgi:hypothetical protein
LGHEVKTGHEDDEKEEFEGDLNQVKVVMLHF